jgi:MscS family membrane protein
MACGILLAAFAAVPLLAQVGAGPANAAATPPAAAPEPKKDALGRDTPRGTVLGFMRAARDGPDNVPPLYLNTRLKGAAAGELARKLYVVLDRRLPARLNELSDRPEGSLANPLKPDQDVIGTISVGGGSLDLTGVRVSRNVPTPVWLFSESTLAAVPDAYGEIDFVSIDRYLPGFLTRTRFGGIRLSAWIGLCLILPLGYWLIGLLALIARPLVRRRLSHAAPHHFLARIVAGPIRLLLLSIVIRWLSSVIELPLIERQFWTAIQGLLGIVAMVWLGLLLTGFGEALVAGRMRGAGRGEMASLLRLSRRVADVLVVAAGALVTLHYFGVDPTAALAGLGIGGIAVALSAQKTLENVIGGVSIIFDKALRAGDVIKLSEIVGTVEYIGLRSTRIRTLDRTILFVPNGQIANANIETLSLRDKFWFRHVLALRFETTPQQLRAVLGALQTYLTCHPSIDQDETIRARFLRVGPFSFDVEVFAYILARDWDRFLEIQQELLLGVMDIVAQAGASVALPTQTLHLAPGRGLRTAAMDSVSRAAALDEPIACGVATRRP